MYNQVVIIVTGSIHCHPEHLADVLSSSLQHVHRSRLEPGCLLHSVHIDAENPNRLVFVEHWSDRAALLGGEFSHIETSYHCGPVFRNLAPDGRRAPITVLATPSRRSC